MVTDTQNLVERRQRSTEAFYGRRAGKPVRPAAQEAHDRLLPQIGIDLTAPAPAPDDLKTLFPLPVRHVRVEIGFGGGEHLMVEATREADVGFIGVEPFINGMTRFLQGLETSGLPNIRVHNDDATQLLDWLPEGSIDELDLLYPDPWEKKKHWKRRFVSERNLDRIARVLKPGGLFRFASDIPHYVNWTLCHVRNHPVLAWFAEEKADWSEPYPGWESTRYENKAFREGRTPAYLTFVRL